MSSTIIKAEYVWIDGDGDLRSKTKIIKFGSGDGYLTEINEVKFYPEWNYDGSSTKQADGSFSEVIIKPRAVFVDPFRDNQSRLVLCDTYLPNGTPHETNERVKAVELFSQKPELEPLFGIEQEFFLTNKERVPLGFENSSGLNNYGDILPQGDYYCGAGADNAIGRDCIEEAFNNCLEAGLHLTGLNAEVAPSQWEFQVCTNGIDVGDELYIMRYILKRTAEKYGYSVTFHPKPIKGSWNGSGCHTNFSTKPMREEGGLKVIHEAIEKLSKKHEYHMSNYGDGNDQRMTGEYETSDYNTFSYGVADRGSSIRIPTTTERDGKGYFEDRRPSSNMDPYKVTSLLFETTSL